MIEKAQCWLVVIIVSGKQLLPAGCFVMLVVDNCTVTLDMPSGLCNISYPALFVVRFSLKFALFAVLVLAKSTMHVGVAVYQCFAPR